MFALYIIPKFSEEDIREHIVAVHRCTALLVGFHLQDRPAIACSEFSADDFWGEVTNVARINPTIGWFSTTRGVPSSSIFLIPREMTFFKQSMLVSKLNIWKVANHYWLIMSIMMTKLVHNGRWGLMPSHFFPHRCCPTKTDDVHGPFGTNWFKLHSLL